MLQFFVGSVLAFLFFSFAVSLMMRNPYKLYVVVGEKGAGKTAFLAKLCNKYEKKIKGPIFSNCGIGFDLPNEYWKHTYPPNSLLLIDEIGLIHDNRQFKQFESECNEFYKYQRKNKLVVVATSQAMDIDKKIRLVTDYILIARRFLCFCIVSRYKQKIVMAQDPTTGGDRLTDSDVKAGIETIFFMPSTFSLFETQKRAKNVGKKAE